MSSTEACMFLCRTTNPEGKWTNAMYYVRIYVMFKCEDIQRKMAHAKYNAWGRPYFFWYHKNTRSDANVAEVDTIVEYAKAQCKMVSATCMKLTNEE